MLVKIKKYIMKNTARNTTTSAKSTPAIRTAPASTRIGKSSDMVAKLRTQLGKSDCQKSALFTILEAGHEFSIAEARRAGVANPSAVVSELRQDGLAIYSNPRKLANGQSVNKYRLNGVQKSA